MARSGGSKSSRPARKGGRPAPRGGSASRSPAASAPRPARERASRPEAPDPARSFRLGVVPGATPGKWIAAWRERLPAVALELIPLTVDQQHAALTAGMVDAALVRLPLDAEQLHVIPLYTEVPVAVVPADSHLTAADELDLSDLSGEVVIVPRDDVLHPVVPGAVAPGFDAPETTADAVATVAAGVGVVIAPMSLARLHARRDVAHRPLRDGPPSTMALAWPREGDSPDVQAFVGIVRGRTPNSSR
ncbi:LysR substrate-binding domain-containing protein [Microbacterium lushaniae]|uniref:Transcriptional regulator n=1 Tax=Microbacterium lushaniae TaxID=2614639 RepID=A0A5J6L0L2_9MICO|nr:LysR substrate-binding domain-containing protein [Microbacterium lushaniae]QEW02019.1 transcriptional regulator [Microbacterium lushaniae]